ncbi:MAG: PHP domain-containing protein [Candidatus Koribacter versatilis]|uniref:DNA polymerase beta n=1 Tax=Candidatus Korobacter versatilis TaxID=658062 RepID=A0A932EP08_9BACT|nr:PHP domain-containing protein [Candidatus Koribacter versatilis]
MGGRRRPRRRANIYNLTRVPTFDNKTIASIFYETADLMEVRNDDPFRIRSYRRAAEAIESLPTQVADMMSEPKRLLEIPGIGKGMAANLTQLFAEGKLALHTELLNHYRPSMLELLKISGLGPKTIALIWDAFQICDLDGVAKLATEGKLRELPRLSEKSEQKILKSIENYRRISGRFHLDDADRTAEQLIAHIAAAPGVERVTPAGSLRRGRETVGDLDLLVTGKIFAEAKKPGKNGKPGKLGKKNGNASDPKRQAVIAHVLRSPGLLDVLAQGDNKVSFKLRSGMQVDVRLLPPESFGAALQYFTGSKNHNVNLRQRALKQGLTLNEYGLATIKGDKRVAGTTEEEVYAKLGLDFIPPELREDCGELDAAATHALPRLIEQRDIQGDVHAHTVETDGKNSIREMAEAARARGYKYCAITDHSKNLAFANGLDDKRAVAHIAKIRKHAEDIEGITVLAGIEVDILEHGDLDLADETLAAMDLVIASVHSHFNQDSAKMTARLLRALSNPHVSIIGHPTGRILLRRDAYAFDLDAVLRAAAANKIAMEHNAYPDRLDLCDTHLRRAQQLGVKIVINTDAHHTTHYDKIRYGMLQLRRAWLTKADVLNTLPLDRFKKAMKRQA